MKKTGIIKDKIGYNYVITFNKNKYAQNNIIKITFGNIETMSSFVNELFMSSKIGGVRLFEYYLSPKKELIRKVRGRKTILKIISELTNNKINKTT